MVQPLRNGHRTAALYSGLLAAIAVFSGGIPPVDAADPVPAPAVAASPMPERRLNDTQKLQLQKKLQQRAAKDKIAALKELATYPYDLEAVKLIVHIGLREPLETVYSAATNAALESRQSAEVGVFLIDRLDQEVNAKKRLYTDYIHRLTALICRFHLPEVYTKLFEFAEEADGPITQTVVTGVMGEFDRASAAQDTTIMPLAGMMAESKIFANVYGVRRCIIDAAIRMHTAESISFLIKQQKLLDGEIRYSIVQHLRAISQQQFPVNSDEWQNWWKENQATFRYPDKIMTLAKVVDEGTPRYYDLPINAKRLVFILDTSGSMLAADPYTMLTRLEAAKRELIGTIDQLPDSTLFNIVIFNTTTFVWQDKLAPATDRWKTAAKQFVAIQRATGKTSTYDALQAAYKVDSNVEAFYLLSDGAPSSGTIIPPQMICDAILKQNQMRRVTINTIGLYGGGDVGHEPFMRALAEQNAGQYRRAN